MNLESTHKSVLLHEVVEGLALREGDTALDGTINGGGHSESLCAQIGSSGTLLGIDLDGDALKRAKNHLKQCRANIVLVQENFRNMKAIAESHALEAFDGILLDLGFSSDQLRNSGRGFSFQKAEPLILSFNNEVEGLPYSARDIVNEWSESQIADILHGYGEERFARRIARRLVQTRREQPIETTEELVKSIEDAVPKWYRFSRLHPATKTFQALRIAVNDEIEALREGLQSAFSLLAHSGRIAVISFHSIEDRIVKRAFEAQAREGKGIIITKKLITPKKQEIKENPRARSAKLRIFESTQNRA